MEIRMPDISPILERSAAVLAGIDLPERENQYKSYAVTNFRGGIGKSTLAFNLAFELSRVQKLLLLDTCSQRNFTQNILGDDIFDVDDTIYEALVALITNAGDIDYEELVMSVRASCSSFKGGKVTHLIPGSSELFVFPSLLYGQLAQYAQLTGKQKIQASANVLTAVKRIIAGVSGYTSYDTVLMDTSPFFGGATHLAWIAADALIIPVRVDQHSIEALKLTLDMLTEKKMDFHRFNAQSGIEHQPVVHAIVMTHCGWNRQHANTPDSSTKFFVEKALEVAELYPELFNGDSPSDCFYLLDDFHSAGRISGKQRIPLSELQAGRKFMVDGQRLEVNPSVDRYKKEIKHLAAGL
jgi:cellulose biosynthesis protein BcsQ